MYAIFSVALIFVVVLSAVSVLYPVHYRDALLHAAAENDLDPALVAAVVREESRFRPDAMSSQGAMGLMQLMPETAQWIVSVSEIADNSATALLDPQMNLHIGCWYLAHLLDIFGDSEVLAVAAYNGGTGRVLRWLQEGVWDGSLERLEEIPAGETREFLRRVTISHRVYRLKFSLRGWE